MTYLNTLNMAASWLASMHDFKVFKVFQSQKLTFSQPLRLEILERQTNCNAMFFLYIKIMGKIDDSKYKFNGALSFSSPRTKG